MCLYLSVRGGVATSIFHSQRLNSSHQSSPSFIVSSLFMIAFIRQRAATLFYHYDQHSYDIYSPTNSLWNISRSW
jgi:hypothetical protein